MALRCLYTDLDGTLLGRFGSLFADADGNFSRNQALLLEACHRAGVEVVVMSGRREAQVLSDSRLMGQSSYIYEAGCGMVIDRERTLLTGEGWVPDDRGTPAERMIASGIPAMLFEQFAGRLEYHAPWHEGRVLSLLFRGKVDVAEVNELVAAHRDGAGLRFLDNGAISRPMEGIEIAHAYHLVPGGASKGKAVGAHLRARGYAPRGMHRRRRLDRGPRRRRVRRPILLHGERLREGRGAANRARRLRQRHRHRRPDGRRRLRGRRRDARAALTGGTVTPSISLH